MQELSKKDLAKAESGGFPIVALILLVVFGSLAAAALPLALGFVSVIVTGALIYFISLQMSTSVFVTNMASMIGIGVAIDYSLFILARYREERACGPRARRGPRPGACDLGPRRHLLRPRRDRLAGRSLDGRQPGAALDGARRDDRRRRLDPHRDDPAAGADRDARRPRHARRRRRQGPALHQATVKVRVPPPPDAERGPSISDSLAPHGSGGDGARLLGAVVARGDGAALDRRDRGQRGAAHPGDPAALDRRPAPRRINQFPKGSDVRVGNELAQAQAGGGADPVQIVAAFDGSPDRAAVAAFQRRLERDRRGRLGRAARLRRRQRPLPGDAERAERVRRGGRPGRAPARHGRPGRRAQPGRERRRRRRNRPRPRRPRPDQRLDVENRPLRPRAQLPRPDGDAALAAAAAEGGADEPALDRRGLRRPRRDLPVGLVRQPARLRKPGRPRHDQRAADLRDRLRPLDGLRGLPHVADPRALPGPRRQRAGRSPKASPRAPARSPRRR